MKGGTHRCHRVCDSEEACTELLTPRRGGRLIFALPGRVVDSGNKQNLRRQESLLSGSSRKKQSAAYGGFSRQLLEEVAHVGLLRILPTLKVPEVGRLGKVKLEPKEHAAGGRYKAEHGLLGPLEESDETLGLKMGDRAGGTEVEGMGKRVDEMVATKRVLVTEAGEPVEVTYIDQKRESISFGVGESKLQRRSGG